MSMSKDSKDPNVKVSWISPNKIHQNLVNPNEEVMLPKHDANIIDTK